ncbi:MAG TPA: hypothetical protein VEV13_07560 [Candidatus Limnocylindria bacterium]|nr:hypothetical protein [Candidatus Limnocylindria bacterium]
MTRHSSSTAVQVMRRAAAVAVAGSGVVLSSALLSPALADSGDDGEVLAEPISLATATLTFVVLPLAIIGLIWFLASVPSMVRSPRYRPGVSWWASPVWFNGPVEAPHETRSGADSERPAAIAVAPDGGGTSARW